MKQKIKKIAEGKIYYIGLKDGNRIPFTNDKK